MENNKVKTVKEWKTFTKIKEIESFLRFTNFYRCFIKTFKELKNKINSQPVFTLFRREEKFWVEIDISGYTIGGVLFQEQEGKWKPIKFLLRTMQVAERNHNIYNKELLAIVETLTK